MARPKTAVPYIPNTNREPRVREGDMLTSEDAEETEEMAKICASCGKKIAGNKTYEWEGQQLCRVCHRELSGKTIQSSAQSTEIPEKLPFNIGAFAVTAFWLMFHGRVMTGIGLIVFQFAINVGLSFGGVFTLVSLAGQIVMFGIAVYFGFVGSRIAWIDRGYSSIDELKRRQNGWRIFGWTVIVAYVLRIVIVLMR